MISAQNSQIVKNFRHHTCHGRFPCARWSSEHEMAKIRRFGAFVIRDLKGVVELDQFLLDAFHAIKDQHYY